MPDDVRGRTDEASAGRMAVEWELVPLVGQLKGPGEDQASVDSVLGRRNRIRLGAPRSTNWIADLLAVGPLPDEVAKRVHDGWDFRRVRPSITLLPDRGCAFLAVELGIELLCARPGSSAVGGDGPVRPLAYDVRPREVLHRFTYRETSRRAAEIGAEAALPPASLLAKFLQETSVERDGERYVRELYGYGADFSEVGWRLQASGRLPLAGDIRDLGDC